MTTKQRMKGWLSQLTSVFQLPSVIVSATTAVVLLFVSFGFQFKTPAALMAEYREAHLIEHQMLERRHLELDAQDTTISNQLQEQSTQLQDQSELLEALVRSECIRETLVNLERAGIVSKCRELGIRK